MEKFLSITEDSTSSNEVEIDADKQKFYNSQLRVGDYAKISASELQKISFDNKSIILKIYYVDMLAKYSVGAGKKFFYGVVSSGKSRSILICKGNR